MKALESRGISKSFGGSRVLNKVSISVEAGERRAIIGPNGAGKTTLFNLVSGILKPDEGEIFFFDKNITRIATYKRAGLGIARTFQKNNLLQELSIEDNLMLALRGRNNGAYMDELLKSFNLTDKKTLVIKKLSYGEQRQVEIMLALAQNPRLILLDEPTSGLSPVEAEILTGIISSLSKDITVVLIEHDMGVVFKLAEKVTVLHQGEVICDGDKDYVRANEKVKEVYMGTEEEAR